MLICLFFPHPSIHGLNGRRKIPVLQVFHKDPATLVSHGHPVTQAQLSVNKSTRQTRESNQQGGKLIERPGTLQESVLLLETRLHGDRTSYALNHQAHYLQMSHCITITPTLSPGNPGSPGSPDKPTSPYENTNMKKKIK